MLATALPDKYSTCICCKSTVCLTEYQFDSGGIKTYITLCSNCVTNMYKESQKEEVVDEHANHKHKVRNKTGM